MFAKPRFFDTDQVSDQELFERVRYILSRPRSRHSTTLAGVVEYYLAALESRENSNVYLQQLKRLQNS